MLATYLFKSKEVLSLHQSRTQAGKENIKNMVLSNKLVL